MRDVPVAIVIVRTAMSDSGMTPIARLGDAYVRMATGISMKDSRDGIYGDFVSNVELND